MSDASVPARLLDLTRLVSRAGRGLTGVDRVELAYLRHLPTRTAPCFGLVRSALGYVLLDARGMKALGDRIEGKVPWGKADLLSRVFRKLDKPQQQAQSDLRRLCIARCHRSMLRKMLTRHLPKGVVYFNVGHSNLTERVISAVRNGPQGQIVVKVHDTIPLDHPLYQTPESVRRFELMLRRVQKHADMVIYNSQKTREDAEGHMGHWGRVPRGVVAHLGLDLVPPAPGDLPEGMPPEGTYFITLGTIEPRKNHALLLDIWERLVKQLPPQEMPHLLIIGVRGWNNEETFFRLDRSVLMGRNVHELSGLSDGAVAALMQGAAGALFPSFAEGYGLPPIEAAAMGVPVICAPLPVYREVLKDIPVYASLKDSYLWQRRITALADSQRAGQSGSARNVAKFHPPTWDAHFNIVLKMM